MPKYSIGCSCGSENTVEAATKEKAIKMFKGMMSKENIAAHMAEKHPGDPIPSVKDAHSRIEREIAEVA